MKKPTPKQIEAEIAKLTELKPKLPVLNYFGERIRDKVEAQIEVLKGNISEDTIYNNSRDESLSNEENEGRQWSYEEGRCALEARKWLDGEEEDSPSKGWEPLAKKGAA